MPISGLERLQSIPLTKEERVKERREHENLAALTYRNRLGMHTDPETLVSQYDAHIQRLTTLHVLTADRMDWPGLSELSDPSEPAFDGVRTKRAQQALDSFSPSLIDYVFMRAARLRRELEEALDRATILDRKCHEEASQKWKVECARNHQVRSFSKSVVEQNNKAWLRVIELLEPLKGLHGVAESANVHWDSPAHAEVTILLTSDEVIPAMSLTLTKRGLLSEKPMAQKKRWEMYEDAICGAAIRATRELFAVLPFEAITVHCNSGSISTETGAHEEVPVLSVHYPRNAFLALIFEHIDPSDSLRRFRHNKDFKRGEGFRPVERISLVDDIA